MISSVCFTQAGRPAFVVNVEVLLRRNGRFLLIRRGAQEAHAPGMLAGVGGKVEADGTGLDVLEETARREVAEEIGVDLSGVELGYVESGFFVTDDGDPVINVVFQGELPASAEPVAVSAEEVAGFVWLTPDEAGADCPPWLSRSLRRADIGTKEG
ncbi:8-oxo-dGTP diphosphatase [Nonomuraea solani]|uniref:8-oxo-dGTP diphosphatase n=1 Tax=Nonomuraea solani TaxID=1144553 RepID=A0A1H6D1T6_9ACTN|nr:NUDIX domain-containing protein [Nonomuraea solani]SEG79034.1 8-oxo-dGTP diphosphatase [Nonomuraea solani]